MDNFNFKKIITISKLKAIVSIIFTILLYSFLIYTMVYVFDIYKLIPITYKNIIGFVCIYMITFGFKNDLNG